MIDLERLQAHTDRPLPEYSMTTRMSDAAVSDGDVPVDNGQPIARSRRYIKVLDKLTIGGRSEWSARNQRRGPRAYRYDKVLRYPGALRAQTDNAQHRGQHNTASNLPTIHPVMPYVGASFW